MIESRTERPVRTPGPDGAGAGKPPRISPAAGRPFIQCPYSDSIQRWRTGRDGRVVLSLSDDFTAFISRYFLPFISPPS